MDNIFLSYRRDDTADDARRIHDRLAERFGEEGVFLDVEDIPLGEDFVDAITDALADSAYVLIAIGPRWLLVTDEQGRRRLDDPEDMVRYEIRTALDGRKRIVPMIIGGAKMPKAGELPEDIAPLVRRNGIEIRPEPDFDMDVDDLMKGLQPGRIVAGRVPTVFRVGLVARNLGAGGGIGWGAASLLLAFFVDKASALLVFPLAGSVAGFSGGAFTGWLTALLVRHRSPPLVGRALVRMGITWSLTLIGSAVLSGFLGYYIGFHMMEPETPSYEGLGFGEAIALAFVTAFAAVFFMLAIMVMITIVGFVTGSAVAAGFFARQFRLRSDQISRGRAFAIALVWMLGGLLTAGLFVALLGLQPDSG